MSLIIQNTNTAPSTTPSMTQSIYSFITSPVTAGAALGIIGTIMAGSKDPILFTRNALLGASVAFAYSKASESPLVQKIINMDAVKSITLKDYVPEALGGLAGAGVSLCYEEPFLWKGLLSALGGSLLAYAQKTALKTMHSVTKETLAPALSCAVLGASTAGVYTLIQPLIGNSYAAHALSASVIGAACYGSGTYLSKAVSPKAKSILNHPISQWTTKAASVLSTAYLTHKVRQNPIISSVIGAVAIGAIYTPPSKENIKLAGTYLDFFTKKLSSYAPNTISKVITFNPFKASRKSLIQSLHSSTLQAIDSALPNSEAKKLHVKTKGLLETELKKNENTHLEKETMENLFDLLSLTNLNKSFYNHLFDLLFHESKKQGHTAIDKLYNFIFDTNTPKKYLLNSIQFDKLDELSKT